MGTRSQKMYMADYDWAILLFLATSRVVILYFIPVFWFLFLSDRWAAAVSGPSLLPDHGGCHSGQLLTRGRFHYPSACFLSDRIELLGPCDFHAQSCFDCTGRWRWRISSWIGLDLFIDPCLLRSLPSHSTVARPRRCPSPGWIPAAPSAFTPRTRRTLSLCVLLSVWWVCPPFCRCHTT